MRPNPYLEALDAVESQRIQINTLEALGDDLAEYLDYCEHHLFVHHKCIHDSCRTSIQNVIANWKNYRQRKQQTESP